MFQSQEDTDQEQLIRRMMGLQRNVLEKDTQEWSTQGSMLLALFTEYFTVHSVQEIHPPLTDKFPYYSLVYIVFCYHDYLLLDPLSNLLATHTSPGQVF